ncbi:DUF885 domain-containing protein [Mangrovivirga cuniculi]|uniref:DUF885 domain-containing protein n=1 Tax=Mangrovivirga cuniculi TaxID=2715131 RepID=A0A4D7JKR9_9BACT|nr:DUF885 domain-containing protein [Mangrovivirga cuniculi]QCK16191.1 DUF885 domain-containing protein [Mangrovivirga cuniculi]
MKLFNYGLIVSLFALLLTSCGNEKDTSEAPTYTEADIKAESQKANHFFDSVFDASVDRSPMYQSYLGIKKDYGKWDDISDENAKKELEIAKKELQYLKDSINPEALDKQTRISYELFKEDRKNEIEDFKWRFHNYPVNQMFGLHSQVPAMLINIHQVTDSSDAAAYISRLKGIKPLFDQLIENLRMREDKGIIPPKFVFDHVIDGSENIIKGAPFTNGEPSTLLADFTKKIDALGLPEEVRNNFINQAREELLNSVQPAYTSLLSFLKAQEERANTMDGIWKWPGGDKYYNVALNRTTTTDLTAEEIHQIGLDEVQRIHGEMREIMKEVGFEGSLQEFFTFLKTDDQFFYPNTDAGKEDYMDSAKSIIDNMESRLDELFITTPKARIQVKRVEKFRENSAGKAFYQSPAPDGSRPGTYYANLADSRNMPKYEMEALAYHEGIPGHHMDRTIAQELTGIPKFRKFGGYTAYIEGWGLYSEFIPKEMGLYENPYSDYGRLAMELWRACRLVVDTGIHSKKWTREEGIDYYLTNTSGSERECVRMVERHIVMPSQATAYKIGMLEILKLRQKAVDELGDKFDIREFHEVVLTSGAVPLNVLGDLVNEYIEETKNETSAENSEV